MLEILVLGLRALQFLFAIIVLGLTGHGKSILYLSLLPRPLDSHTPSSLLSSKRTELTAPNSGFLGPLPLSKFLPPLYRSLDPPDTPLRCLDTKVHGLIRERFRHLSPGCLDHALLVRRLHRLGRPRSGFSQNRFDGWFRSLQCVRYLWELVWHHYGSCRFWRF